MYNKFNKEILENNSVNEIIKSIDENYYNPVKENNSKKIYNKIVDEIKSKINNYKAKKFPAIFLRPINDKEKIKERQNKIKKVYEIKFDKIENLDDKINNLEKIEDKITINQKIITFDEEIKRYFENKFDIDIEVFTEEEIQRTNTNIDECIVVENKEMFISSKEYSKEKFERLLNGNIIENNKKIINNYIEIIKKFSLEEVSIIEDFIRFFLEKDEVKVLEEREEIEKKIEDIDKESIDKVVDKINNLDRISIELNQKIKEILSSKKISLEGDELLEIMSSKDTSFLEGKFSDEIKNVIVEREKEIIDEFKSLGVNIYSIFKDNSYPVEVDDESREELLDKVGEIKERKLLKRYEELGKFDIDKIKQLYLVILFIDFIKGLQEYIDENNLKFAKLGEEMKIIEGKNLFIREPKPINYALGTEELENVELNKEKVSVLTGANSGGKTTLLEMVMQIQILTMKGLPVPALEKSVIDVVDEIVYIKKFSGTVGSGAFEQTVKALLEIIEKKNKKLILIDEFEAITEPGAAAKILTNFLEVISNEENYCISVSHLGEEIKEFLEEKKTQKIRLDGISAKGLDDKSNIVTDHQPQFYQLGKSTPELILKKILNDEKFWKNKSDDTKDLLEKISK